MIDRAAAARWPHSRRGVVIVCITERMPTSSQPSSSRSYTAVVEPSRRSSVIIAPSSDVTPRMGFPGRRWPETVRPASRRCSRFPNSLWLPASQACRSVCLGWAWKSRDPSARPDGGAAVPARQHRRHLLQAGGWQRGDNVAGLQHEDAASINIPRNILHMAARCKENRVFLSRCRNMQRFSAAHPSTARRLPQRAAGHEPHLTRSSLHRCLQRHGISRLGHRSHRVKPRPSRLRGLFEGFPVESLPVALPQRHHRLSTRARVCFAAN